MTPLVDAADGQAWCKELVMTRLQKKELHRS
jgi:hypothetical protein